MRYWQQSPLARRQRSCRRTPRRGRRPATLLHPEHGQGADLRASATDVAPALTVSDGRSERGVRVVEVAGLIERHHAPQQVAGKAPDETDISPLQASGEQLARSGCPTYPALGVADTPTKKHTITFDQAQITHPENRSRCTPDAPAPALAAQNQLRVATYQVRSSGSHAAAVAAESDVARTLDSNGPWGASAGGTIVAGTPDGRAYPLATKQRSTAWGPDTFVAHALGVRRLTPRECERLMGFPDDWTLVPNYVATLRGKRVSSDTKRYEALGNSVAVPVVEWIGRRLKAVEKS